MAALGELRGDRHRCTDTATSALPVDWHAAVGNGPPEDHWQMS